MHNISVKDVMRNYSWNKVINIEVHEFCEFYNLKKIEQVQYSWQMYKSEADAAIFEDVTIVQQ